VEGKNSNNVIIEKKKKISQFKKRQKERVSQNTDIMFLPSTPLLRLTK